MKWNVRTRCALMCVGFIALFSVFSFRLVYLQVIRHDYYAAEAADNHGTRKPIYAARGTIVAVNGEILAHNLPVRVVFADPVNLTNRDAAVTILHEVLKIPRDELEEKLGSKKHYVVLQRDVPEQLAKSLDEKIGTARVRGIGSLSDTTRIYPNHSMLSHVIGFTDFDHLGADGVEKSMERYLHGVDGYRHIEHDPTGKEIVLYRGEQRDAHNGAQVRLTIDLNLQNIVENEIDAAMRDFRPIKATIILMRPQTGEILAMANRPTFDLNLRAQAKPEQMKNRAISDMMEPGSTFKIVTAAAALNERKVRLDSMIFCENGRWRFGGRLLHDHGSGYGELSVQDVLVHSSNIGAAKLAIGLGEQKFYEYIRRFGFGDRTNIELPGESGGMVHPTRDWNKLSIARIPMGQGIAVTPLQMTMAMATIANGGKLMMPRIVKSITTEDGETTEFPPTPVRQVISPETARQIGYALRGVVSDRGTAKAAAVPGFTIAGKTGTAQKPKPGGYETDKYIVSFLGFLPAENPEFVGLVVLDDAHPKNPSENYGGQVAGPIFSRVAEQAARYLDLEPHEDVGKPMTAERVALTNASRR